jgi:hypothetical protein
VGRLTARLAIVVAAVAVAVLAGRALRDDDRPVDRSDPAAQRAVAVAQEIVTGTVVDVRRDGDNGKWEVTMRQGDREYEVELAPGDFSLLRLDYD